MSKLTEAISDVLEGFSVTETLDRYQSAIRRAEYDLAHALATALTGYAVLRASFAGDDLRGGAFTGLFFDLLQCHKKVDWPEHGRLVALKTVVEDSEQAELRALTAVPAAV